MSKTKTITDFIAADISRLRIDEPIPVNIYLYFQASAHLLLWQTSGTNFTPEMLDKYRQKGLKQIWVKKIDSTPFFNYLEGNEEDSDDSSGPPEPVLEETTEQPYVPRGSLSTELTYIQISGKELHDIIHDGEKSEREKRALIAKASRSMLGELSSVIDPERQQAIKASISKVIEDLLALTTFQARSLALSIWGITSKEGELSHGVNVATMSVLFAMAFGRIEENLLADIAMAALFHDIGITQIPIQLAQTPWLNLSSDQMRNFLYHEGFTERLMTTYAPDLPKSVKTLVMNHHGKYSNPGKNNHLADIAQLIAMADIVDSMCNGMWDGQERTIIESLLSLENMEMETPETGGEKLFNPEVFNAVLRWIRGNIPENTLMEALSIVGNQVKSVKPHAA